MRRPVVGLERRSLLRAAGGLGLAAASGALRPAWAHDAMPGAAQAAPTLSGDDIQLSIGHAMPNVDGRRGHGVAVNGAVPGPLLRLKEGRTVRLAVTNTLDEPSSIHWHGMLVPPPMDGVPGVSFPGIPAGQSFRYEFPVRQAGTYWYHSHSGMQEQEGLYGPIVVDPEGPDPIASDREYVVMLSDYSFMHPHKIFERLKQDSEAFNLQHETVAGLLAGKDQTLGERFQWAKMLMDPTDISDVTGSIYTFLVNGRGPKDNWTALFRPGERVRLRFVNAAAQTIFDVRIPGLKLSIVAADGQPIRPAEVDEFQIANAETYDVIVQPADDRAYTLVAEAVDRSGMGRATLAPRMGMTAEVPPLRKRPIANMRDMGMDMSAMAARMSGMAMTPQPAAVPGMAAPKPRGSDVMAAMRAPPGAPQMNMSMLNPVNAPGVKLGPGVQMIAPMASERTGEAGQGLASVGHRVLTYRDLVALEPNPDRRAPQRSVEIHLTGNMQRFIWGFDGWSYAERPKPYAFRAGERVRVTLVNDTMMAHPIHLHGHFFELVQGQAGRMPRKHTVNVLPGGKVAFDFTPVAGDWAFHCHMLYHMHAGMFQVFAVRPAAEGA